MSFKAGDIILFYPDGKNPIVDFFINFVSKRTHVGIFVDEFNFVEANISGVVKTKFRKEFKNITVYRPDVDKNSIIKSIRIAHEHIGDKYSVSDSVISGILRLLGLTSISEHIDRNWNCSEFVGYIIRYGFDIWIMPGIPTSKILPDDIESEAKRLNWEIIYE